MWLQRTADSGCGGLELRMFLVGGAGLGIGVEGLGFRVATSRCRITRYVHSPSLLFPRNFSES